MDMLPSKPAQYYWQSSPMMSQRSFVLLLGLMLVHVQARTHDQCTSILVGKGGSANGAPMTTHTNDCSNCDFRLLKVPAMNHPIGAMVDIPLVKMDYPRYVGLQRGPAFEPSTLDASLRQSNALSNLTVILGQIPQVRHTYAYLDGLYGIMNEHQVSIGESTCGGRLVSQPLGFNGGQALFDISALSRLAMERCTTAREAVELMGDLAVTHGYYGAVYDSPNKAENLAESGEALTVTDPEEAWMFHIHPDDSGASAVWVAQRVPTGHVSAIANQFVIRDVNLSDVENFAGSTNVLEVARRAGFVDLSSSTVDFTSAFALRQEHGYHVYSTRRVWRVFQLANPTLRLSPETSDVLGSNYPFSVAPERPLSSADIMRMQRDHYEGTAFDMTSGPAAGPYGDPDRYDMASQGNVSVAQMKRRGGRFERAISIFRASYSFVTECRSSVSTLWFGPYAPHATVYLPVYAAVMEVPTPLASGSLFRYDASSAYWTHAFVGNWVARYYTHAITQVKDVQSRLESKMIEAQDQIEAHVEALIKQGQSESTVASFLTHASFGYAQDVHAQVQDLGHALITKYHDGYHMEGLESSAIQPQSFFYPIWWLEEVGFFHSNDIENSVVVQHSLTLLMTLSLIIVGATVLGMGMFIGRRLERNSYKYKSIE